jgi:hypothetical protein
MKKTSGQSLTEYGLAIGLVVIIGIGGLALLGSQTSNLLGDMIGKKGRGTQNLAASSLSALDSGIPARPDSMDLTIPVRRLNGEEIQITVKNYPMKMTENDMLTGGKTAILKFNMPISCVNWPSNYLMKKSLMKISFTPSEIFQT